jgi:hypothetical protein
MLPFGATCGIVQIGLPPMDRDGRDFGIGRKPDWAAFTCNGIGPTRLLAGGEIPKNRRHQLSSRLGLFMTAR